MRCFIMMVMAMAIVVAKTNAPAVIQLPGDGREAGGVCTWQLTVLRSKYYRVLDGFSIIIITTTTTTTTTTTPT
jgi:hypothetical protein